MYTKRIATAPAVEPVTLAEAKLHLRVTQSGEDTLISALIKAAREYAEGVLNRALIDQTWDLYLDAFPGECDGYVLKVPMSPLKSVTYVKYLDEAGVQQTLSASLYAVDITSEPGRIYPAYQQVWPTLRTGALGAVVVRFVAGYGADGTFVPESIKAAIRLAVAHWYENREDTVVGTIVSKLPLGVDALLWQERIW